MIRICQFIHKAGLIVSDENPLICLCCFTINTKTSYTRHIQSIYQQSQKGRVARDRNCAVHGSEKCQIICQSITRTFEYSSCKFLQSECPKVPLWTIALSPFCNALGIWTNALSTSLPLNPVQRPQQQLTVRALQLCLLLLSASWFSRLLRNISGTSKWSTINSQPSLHYYFVHSYPKTVQSINSMHPFCGWNPDSARFWHSN